MPVIDIEAATAADRDAVLALLAGAGLPADGLEQHFANAIVARRDGAVVGSAALEIYQHGALLRSVAVATPERGTGLGVRLTEAAIARARARHIPALYLLTTTADRFFPRFGFTVITREDVPESVTQSIEFRSACPASAVVMRKVLAD